MQRAFVIRPFGTKKDSSGREIDFERIHAVLIGPALEALGLGGGTTGEIVEAGNIREDMFGLIVEADLVVCDITVHNANVFYELGIRHALRSKRSVLIRGTPAADAVPFDILTDRYLAYELAKPEDAKDELERMLRATLASERGDSPVFKMLPALPEIDPAAVQVLPQELAEEVERAEAAGARGWLRLLASEVAGRRFQWPALRLIGQAQWAIEDHIGARHTWERVLENDPDDLAANLALANLYERQFRAERRDELLEASEQSIERVLAGGRASLSQRAEALALRGRNAKTRWRLEFEGLPEPGQRRDAATNRLLLASCDAYREAYHGDLNHFWSGIAALQMCAIAANLSQDPAWPSAFDDSGEAETRKSALARELEELKDTVRLAVRAALKRLPPGHKDRVWAEISNADLLFVADPLDARVRRAYLDAVPRNNPWVWNATKGQLELSATLGIRAALARDVIAAVDARMEATETGVPSTVIVAGHRVDEPGRAEPRFPPDAVPRARERLRERLEALRRENGKLRVLASGAPGTDILCHELCRELGIESTMCLPMPVDCFSRLAFKDLDAWRSRFLALVGGHQPLRLSDREGLPRWLEGAGCDPWERGNRWVLELALSAGAPKVSLVALWDGKPVGDAAGGTAHIVQIARAAGMVDVAVIDAAGLSEPPG